MYRDDEEAGARKRAAREVSDRLRGRGVTLTGTEHADELAELLSAVERFELLVEAHGGDLMVDDLKSSRPDDSHFVLPRRVPAETIPAYIARIDAAAERLRRHPGHPD